MGFPHAFQRGRCRQRAGFPGHAAVKTRTGCRAFQGIADGSCP
jgi:hypothetical protein